MRNINILIFDNRKFLFVLKSVHRCIAQQCNHRNKNCGRMTYILGKRCDISTIPELYNSLSGSRSETKTAYSQFFSRRSLSSSFKNLHSFSWWQLFPSHFHLKHHRNNFHPIRVIILVNIISFTTCFASLSFQNMRFEILLSAIC